MSTTELRRNVNRPKFHVDHYIEFVPVDEPHTIFRPSWLKDHLKSWSKNHRYLPTHLTSCTDNAGKSRTLAGGWVNWSVDMQTDRNIKAANPFNATLIILAKRIAKELQSRRPLQSRYDGTYSTPHFEQ